MGLRRSRCSTCCPNRPPLSRPNRAIATSSNSARTAVTTVLIPRGGHALLPEQPRSRAKALLDYLKKIKHG